MASKFLPCDQFLLLRSEGGSGEGGPGRQTSAWTAFHNSALAICKSKTDRFLKGKVTLNLKGTIFILVLMTAEEI